MLCAQTQSAYVGKIRLMHSFYPGGASQDFAVSELNGYMNFDTAQHRIQRLRIVTTKADYVGNPFATSLVSMSKETLDALASAPALQE